MERESRSYYPRGRSPSRSGRRGSSERWRVARSTSYSRSPSSDASRGRKRHCDKYRCHSRSRTRSPSSDASPRKSHHNKYSCHSHSRSRSPTYNRRRSGSDSHSRSPWYFRFSQSRSRSRSPGCDRSYAHRRDPSVYPDVYRGRSACNSGSYCSWSRSWSYGGSRSRSRSQGRSRSTYRSRSRSRSRSRARRYHSPAFSGSRSRSHSPAWQQKGGVDEKLDGKNYGALVSKFVDSMALEQHKNLKGGAAQLDSLADMEEVLMKKLGIPVSFDSTKGKHIADANVYAVKLPSKRQPRQYMNRRCGFNKPLPAERNR